MTSLPPTAGTACQRCQGTLKRTAYEVRTGDGRSPRCLRCALSCRPLIARSLAIALAVGTLLTAINQGNVIFQGDASPALAWKIPLTFAVPYCVATVGALLNSRAGPA